MPYSLDVKNSERGRKGQSRVGEREPSNDGGTGN